jgi:hypothetical protein
MALQLTVRPSANLSLVAPGLLAQLPAAERTGGAVLELKGNGDPVVQISQLTIVAPGLLRQLPAAEYLDRHVVELSPKGDALGQISRILCSSRSCLVMWMAIVGRTSRLH